MRMVLGNDISNQRKLIRQNEQSEYSWALYSRCYKAKTSAER